MDATKMRATLLAVVAAKVARERFNEMRYGKSGATFTSFEQARRELDRLDDEACELTAAADAMIEEFRKSEEEVR